MRSRLVGCAAGEGTTLGRTGSWCSGRARQAQQAQGGCAGQAVAARGTCAARAQLARGTAGAAGAQQGAAGARRASGLGAGRAAWPRAVHSVHSACFWPDLTRYFS